MIDDATLRRIPLFADFDAVHLEHLRSVVRPVRFPKHGVILREGEPGDAFYLIASGSVAVVRKAPDGRETILSILKEGEFFGEMSLFDEGARSASIRTLTDVELGMIRQHEFLALLDEQPSIAKQLVVALSARLRAANAQIAANLTQEVPARLAALLLHLAERFGEPAERGTRIGIRLTNQEMANMIGSSRESVNRALNRFWDEHLIDMREPHVVIADADGLRALVT
ncbi:MAG: Crp/Fnr family transcriptional regulator [Candidatus Eremiobacteraeota bacterium]|nr:Crp/Fnr family transcriptional regulator [Candidatus Eremiobacteraeota bacterium]